jgi:PAS domain S-box-containing protein
MNLSNSSELSEWVLSHQDTFNILDSIKMYFIVKDLNSNLVWVNKNFATIIGKEQNEIINKTAEEVFSNCNNFEQSILNSYVEDDKEILKTKSPKSDIVEKLLTVFGTKWIKTTKFPLLNKSGEAIGIIVISIDITEQYTISMEFELLLDSLSDSLIITDHSGIILKVYKGKTGLINDYNEHIGKNIQNIFSVSDFSTKITNQIDKILNDSKNNILDPFGYYFEFSTKDKQYEITIDIFNHSKLVFSIRDISLRKKLDKFDHLLEEVRSMNNSMIRSLITE